MKDGRTGSRGAVASGTERTPRTGGGLGAAAATPPAKVTPSRPDRNLGQSPDTIESNASKSPGGGMSMDIQFTPKHGKDDPATREQLMAR